MAFGISNEHGGTDGLNSKGLVTGNGRSKRIVICDMVIS